MYKAIHSARLYEQIVEQIEQHVLTGEIKVGDRLPPEHALAAQFGVSRTAVREAIKTLREKGLLEIQPGRGTFITNGTSHALHHSLNLLIKVGDLANVDSLTEVREILEPETAALAAERISDEQLRSLQQAVDEMDAALNNADHFIESDLNFHLTLAQATQNPLLFILTNSIVDLLREQRKRIFNVPGGPQREQFHHKRILRTVQRRDLHAARQAMCAHLRQVRRDSAAAIKK